MIDGRNELVKLATLIDWEVFEREWSGFFPSGKGRSATEPRLVAGLLYLQHAYRLSDEAVVARWVENPYYQHFTGETFFQHRPTRVLISGPRRGLTPKLIADLRRRSAIEAEIGHMKTDGRLSRCPLRGTVGNALFAVLYACGHNIRKILAHLRAWLAWIVTALWADKNELQRRHRTIVAARTLCSG
jgi:hypothetical protein